MPVPARVWIPALMVIVAWAGCGPDDGAAPEPEPAVAAPASGPFVRVLGSVQDGGLPHAACDCPRCAAARQDPSRLRRIASLAIRLPESDAVYLVDATPDIREQLHDVRDLRGRPDGFDRSPVEGVFLTHAHIGHYLGLAFFGFEAVHTRDLPVYCMPRMAELLRRNAPWEQLVTLGNVRLEPLAAGTPVALGDGVEVTALFVPHRDEYSETVGLMVEGPRRRLLYVPDTDGWPAWSPPLTEVLEGVDIAILDGTFYSADELPGRDVSSIGHPLITRTMDLLGAAVETGDLEVWFTHLNHSNPALEPDSEATRAIAERGFGVVGENQDFPI
jgi:pyrroloquinoline quinone biosynthesis protein B